MSGSSLVLDANIVLYLLAGDSTLAEFLDGKAGYVSVITELELVGFPDISDEELERVRGFLSDCGIIDINDSIRASTRI